VLRQQLLGFYDNLSFMVCASAVSGADAYDDPGTIVYLMPNNYASLLLYFRFSYEFLGFTVSLQIKRSAEVNESSATFTTMRNSAERIDFIIFTALHRA
jgi:hypothetical protein